MEFISIDELFQISSLSLEWGILKLENLYNKDQIVNHIISSENDKYIFLDIYINKSPTYNTGITVKDVLDRLNSYVDRGYQGGFGRLDDSSWMFFIKKV